MFSYDRRKPWYSGLTLSWGQMLALSFAAIFVAGFQLMIYSQIQGQTVEFEGVCPSVYTGADSKDYPKYLKVNCGGTEFMVSNGVAINYYRLNAPIHCTGSRGAFTKTVSWECSVPFHTIGR